MSTSHARWYKPTASRPATDGLASFTNRKKTQVVVVGRARCAHEHRPRETHREPLEVEDGFVEAGRRFSVTDVKDGVVEALDCHVYVGHPNWYRSVMTKRAVMLAAGLATVALALAGCGDSVHAGGENAAIHPSSGIWVSPTRSAANISGSQGSPRSSSGAVPCEHADSRSGRADLDGDRHTGRGEWRLLAKRRSGQRLRRLRPALLVDG